MSNFALELPSVKKMKKDIYRLKFLAPLGGKKVKDQLKQQEKQFNKLVEGINKFNENFSKKGWILYDLFDINVMFKANEIYEKEGAANAEKVLIDYYINDFEFNKNRLNTHPEFICRFNLINLAFDDHMNERYHASVPVFLIIIDGIVNDYTKRKGFFAEGTDVSAWDCLVGADEALDKLKNAFNQSRKRTNDERIEMPYRNGILHGRDLNYNNAYVSCKCLALLFAIHDWMSKKKNEKNRKEKFKQESVPPTFKELARQIRKNEFDKKRISEWSRKEILINRDIPESGDIQEYSNYKCIEPIINMRKYWKEKNYGKLSLILNNMYRYESNEKLRPKLCRQQFTNKEFISFKIKEVEDRAISLKRILIEVKWSIKDNVKNAELEFGIIYQDEDEKALIPEEKEGTWVLIPWDVSELNSF
ncbi:hypothetical protein GOQ29_14285 [Clostridium sp. D2Q-14]|uniref:hypothetical protein n=1 Tax=Anaeromonas gelatinilytica TaxID=2683194 RepID=UPI00193BB427|nr:hypothetical protein [Anaeromonas gelatinilytica]MBS4536786.1 hypothetical protein [Anaeromonas gelatinilytica]